VTTSAPSLIAGRRVYGHRGASLELPENTVESFARALEHGVTHLESDVHMTADGELVLAHDPTGTRMAGVDAEIRRVRYDELARWDVGHGFVDDEGKRPFAGRGMRVPRLQDVIEAFPHAPLNLDMKQTEPTLVEPLVDLLRRTGAASRVVLASFSDANLARAKALGFEGALALSKAQVVALLTVPLAILRARRSKTTLRAQVPPRAGAITLANTRFISRCHALDIGVDFWTVNDPREAQALVTLGADGIMTDDPKTIIEALRAPAHHAPGA
jgi:glycerophosphoryl diester phosphodiesterase